MIWKMGVNEFVLELESITWHMQSYTTFIIFMTSIAIGRSKDIFLHNCYNKSYWATILNPKKNIKTYAFYNK